MCWARLRCWSRRECTGRGSTKRTARRSGFCTSRPTRCTGRWGPAIRRSAKTTAYAPNSPYAASKAGSDHLARAYFHTFGLPVLTTNCSNNYGPFQFPEKLIPLMILNALEGKPLPVYGDGKNVRDWLFVEDHCAAIRAVLERGRPGETYNIGGNSERANIDVVTTICDLVDEMRPRARCGTAAKLITYVQDRPGHDRRYAIDAEKIARELGWEPAKQFESGLRKTVRWYLENAELGRKRADRSVSRLDRAELRGARNVERIDMMKRHHSCRRIGNAALSRHPRGVEAASAGVQQADDLLPAEHADAGGYPRDPGDLDAAGYRPVRGTAGRRAALGPGYQLRGAAESRWPGAGVPNRAGFHRRADRAR